MVTLSKLNEYLDNNLVFDKSLDVGKIDPFMTNGLMVKGREEVKKIGYAVSASIELFEKVRKQNCNVIIVHHSFNLPPYNVYDGIFQNKIAYLLKNEMSLFGYHFLLDAHPKIGNNFQLLKTIGAIPKKPYEFRGNAWGFMGEYENKREMSEVIAILKPHLSRRMVIYDFGPEKIRRIIALSGKGAPHTSYEMTNLKNTGVDLYITGEVHEWNRELFREAKINFIAGGHYHTERFGIRALMDKMKKDLPQVEHIWLELENEV